MSLSSEITRSSGYQKFAARIEKMKVRYNWKHVDDDPLTFTVNVLEDNFICNPELVGTLPSGLTLEIIEKRKKNQEIKDNDNLDISLYPNTIKNTKTVRGHRHGDTAVDLRNSILKDPSDSDFSDSDSILHKDLYSEQNSSIMSTGNREESFGVTNLDSMIDNHNNPNKDDSIVSMNKDSLLSSDEDSIINYSSNVTNHMIDSSHHFQTFNNSIKSLHYQQKGKQEALSSIEEVMERGSTLTSNTIHTHTSQFDTNINNDDNISGTIQIHSSDSTNSISTMSIKSDSSNTLSVKSREGTLPQKQSMNQLDTVTSLIEEEHSVDIDLDPNSNEHGYSIINNSTESNDESHISRYYDSVLGTYSFDDSIEKIVFMQNHPSLCQTQNTTMNVDTVEDTPATESNHLNSHEEQVNNTLTNSDVPSKTGIPYTSNKTENIINEANNKKEPLESPNLPIYDPNHSVNIVKEDSKKVSKIQNSLQKSTIQSPESNQMMNIYKNTANQKKTMKVDNSTSNSNVSTQLESFMQSPPSVILDTPPYGINSSNKQFTFNSAEYDNGTNITSIKNKGFLLPTTNPLPSPLACINALSPIPQVSKKNKKINTISMKTNSSQIQENMNISKQNISVINQKQNQSSFFHNINMNESSYLNDSVMNPQVRYSTTPIPKDDVMEHDINNVSIDPHKKTSIIEDNNNISKQKSDYQKPYLTENNIKIVSSLSDTKDKTIDNVSQSVQVETMNKLNYNPLNTPNTTLNNYNTSVNTSNQISDIKSTEQKNEIQYTKEPILNSQSKVVSLTQSFQSHSDVDMITPQKIIPSDIQSHKRTEASVTPLPMNKNMKYQDSSEESELNIRRHKVPALGTSDTSEITSDVQLSETTPMKTKTASLLFHTDETQMNSNNQILPSFTSIEDESLQEKQSLLEKSSTNMTVSHVDLQTPIKRESVIVLNTSSSSIEENDSTDSEIDEITSIFSSVKSCSTNASQKNIIDLMDLTSDSSSLSEDLPPIDSYTKNVNKKKSKNVFHKDDTVTPLSDGNTSVMSPSILDVSESWNESFLKTPTKLLDLRSPMKDNSSELSTIIPKPIIHSHTHSITHNHESSYNSSLNNVVLNTPNKESHHSTDLFKEPPPRQPFPVNDTLLMTSKNRDIYTKTSYDMFNHNIFEDKLPIIHVLWSSSLTKTAGTTHMKKEQGKNIFSIELSEKVCTTSSTMRTTLLHEMCHCICFYETGENHGHDKLFKEWGAKATALYPEYSVTTKHSFEIFHKFRWQCTNPTCARIVGRDSKSIDIERQVCGKCHSKLKYLGRFNKDGTIHKSKKPSEYNKFLAENYDSVKEKILSNGDKNTDVMKEIARLWKEKKHTE